MRVIGLTGSIAMGKTTTAAMFRARGVPVHDADEAVHRLYAGEAVAPIEAAFPGVSKNGAVNRERLAARLLGDRDALTKLEAIVHPMVREDQAAFVRRMQTEGRPFVVLDVPLLFETGGENRVDVVAVATAAPEIQRARLLTRPGMDEVKLALLIARQMPDAEKRRRAHFLVDSGRGFDAAARQVDALLRALFFTA
jgi:dephospho-CoA kinase